MLKIPTLIETLDKEKLRISTGFSLAGRVKCVVVDSKSGVVVKEYPEQKNLILNQGMDLIATVQVAGVFTNCCAGTGTTPTADDSGLTTAAQSGTTVTLSGGAFTFTNTGTDAGKMIKWDTGEEARIVTITDATHAVVANSATVAAAQFTVYRTNQVGLTTESKRTSTYLTGASNCGSTWASNTISHKRTFDFTAEVGAVSYTEIGLSNSSSAGNNLFSRILLGSAVNLVASQQLRVVYTLDMTWTPNTAGSVDTTIITGWSTTTGTAQIQWPALSVVSTAGAVGKNITFDTPCLEPSQSSSTWMYSGSTAHNAFNSAGPSRTSIASVANSPASYTAFNFYRETSGVFPVGSGNATNIRTIALMPNPGNSEPTLQGLVIILDSDQTKDNTHTLTITWRITWSRTLA